MQVEDINLNVGTESDLSESIIKDVKGVSIVIRRSLRDLMHQIPSIDADIKVMDYVFIDVLVHQAKSFVALLPFL